MVSQAGKVAVISPEPLYDFQVIPQGAQVAEVNFFMEGLSAGRTVADTNVETAGQLPSDRLKAISQVALLACFVGNTAATVAQAKADLHTLASTAVLVLHLNNNPILRLPAGMCGGGYGITGVSAVGSVDAGSAVLTLGNPGAKGFVLPERDWVPITGGATFRVELVWSGTANPTFALARRVGIAIGGPLATKGGR